ncbi:cell division protein FtsQ [Flavobacterium sp. DG1-102-2]|uniref:cell division protein FtsQ/DivIB n=1 Tax=Flavobacterium sp. DG1-102-2 TaxID=3081663 RepID=UPI002949E270|nr:cell division protein FtsQ [Flavobacterium sp. DG1-102-2]MDV6169138.1 cell division protein FtsQ [Flavobacterium sp. DG1-102-2]
MKKIKWNDVRLVLILGAVIFLYSFSSKRNDNRKLKEANIEFAQAEDFITHEKVNNLLIQNFGSIQSIRKDKLDLNSVEKSLDKNPMIDKAEVYATVDGKLKAKISQRKPVARIFLGEESYYIDYRGDKMPLSETYTARVPIVTGQVSSVEKKRLHELLNYINDDVFLTKNIIGIDITPGGSFKMKSRNHDFEILFGRPINVEKKFNNYKAFLQNAAKDTLVKQYKTINLKFTQQVVCTKK